MRARNFSLKGTYIGLLILAAGLSGPGCMKLGPDYERPALTFQIPPTFQHAPAHPVKLPRDVAWWTLFEDAELNRLVEHVLQRNWDIKGATEKVLELASELVVARSERLPSLNMEAGFERRKRPVIGIVPGKIFTTKTDTYTLAFPAAFEIDLWGRLKRAEEAARARLLEAEENRMTVILGVVAEAVTIYFKIKALEKRLELAKARIQDHIKELEILERRFKRGLGSLLDITRARRGLAQARTALPSLEIELGKAQQQLALLCGRYPFTELEIPPRPKALPLPPAIPPGLPSDLLLRRPDVRAQEARLRVLNAMVGVAKASRFPRITLTGSFGYTSEGLKELLEPTSELWTLAAGLFQPLFDAGRLKASQRAAEARYRQGLTRYAKVVLQAFMEVERALLTRERLLEKRKMLQEFLGQARLSEQTALWRYKRGIGDYLSVLEARQKRYIAEEELVLVDLAIVTNQVALYRALGGGWDVSRE